MKGREGNRTNFAPSGGRGEFFDNGHQQQGYKPRFLLAVALITAILPDYSRSLKPLGRRLLPVS